MAGPLFLALASVRGNAKIDVARKIARAGAENNIGLIFGEDVVQFILRDYPGFVEDMMKHSSQAIVFLVTSHPLENDVMDLFEQELNPSRGVDPSKSRVLRFLKEVWSINEIRELLVAMWDLKSPSYEDLRKRELSFDDFCAWVRNWYGWESKLKLKQQGSPEGIFKIVRST